MDNRSLAAYTAMDRVASIIAAHPELSRRASESRAFELYNGVISGIAALERERALRTVEAAELRARKAAVKKKLELLVRSLRATASLLGTNRTTVAAVVGYPVTQDDIAFHSSMYAVLSTASAYAQELIDAGLHPTTFDDGFALVEEFCALHEELCHHDHFFSIYSGQLRFLIKEGRARQRQLALDLLRGVGPELRADWRAAAALGRKHRAKSLRAGDEQKLLPPPASMLPENADEAPRETGQSEA